MWIDAANRTPEPAHEPDPVPHQPADRAARVDLALTEEERIALEASEHYTPRTPGRVSGYSAAVRAILRERLGLPPLADVHQQQSAKLKGKPRKGKACDS